MEDMMALHRVKLETDRQVHALRQLNTRSPIVPSRESLEGTYNSSGEVEVRLGPPVPDPKRKQWQGFSFREEPIKLEEFQVYMTERMRSFGHNLYKRLLKQLQSMKLRKVFAAHNQI